MKIVKVGNREYQQIKGPLGLLGWFFRLIFVLWHLLTLIALIYGVNIIEQFSSNDRSAYSSLNEGTENNDPLNTIVLTLIEFTLVNYAIAIIFIWFIGTAILGIYMLLTGRTKTLVLISESTNSIWRSEVEHELPKIDLSVNADYQKD